MSNPKQDPKRTADAPAFVLLDYNGNIGSHPKGGRKIPHRMSPLNAAKPEQGVPSLHLQPGFNRIDAKTWAHYPNYPGIDSRIKSREIRTLKDVAGIDEQTLTGMIDRSYCHPSLRWLRAELAEASVIDGQDRDALLQAIDDQLRKHPVVISSSPYVRPAAFVPQPSMSA